MAETDYKYTNTPVISSIIAGGQKRYIKDAEARTAIDGILADYLKAADKTALKTEIDKKVDKAEGMGLSHNDYDDAAKAEVAKIADKVDKVEGKGLSTNDYDDAAVAEVAKIAGKQDALAFEGTYDASTNKVTTKSYVDDLVGSLKTIEIKVVDSLPTTGESNVIYLVPKASGEGYVEYVWVASATKFEEIGDTDIDLSDYRKAADQDAIDETKVDKVKDHSLIADTEIARLAGIKGNEDGSITVDGKTVENYDDTELAGKVSDLENAPANKITDENIEDWNGEIGAKEAAEAAQDAVDALEEVVGDSTKGLVKKVDDLEKAPANGITADDIAAWNAEKGAKAAAKAADDKAVAETTRAEGAEEGLDNRIKVFEANGAHDVAALEGKVAALEGTSYEVTVGTETVTVPGQTVSTAAQTITGITATGSISGTATISSSSADADATLTKADYTPAGSVSVSLKDAETATAADISRGDYTPTGAVEVNLRNNTVLGSVTDAGTTPSINASAFNGGTLAAASTATFVKKTINAKISSTDDECLEFFEVEPTDTNFYGTAVTAQGEYTAASIGDGFFSAGSMPTFATATVEVSSATFNGTTETGLKVSGVTYKKQAVDTAEFAGTKVEDFQVTGVSYKKVTVADTATVTASNVELAVGDITVTAKEVTIADTTITVAKAGTYDVTKKTA